MGFWDKVKDFVGLEDEYYDKDDFFEEDEVLEEENVNTKPVKEEVKSNINFETKKEERPKRSTSYTSYNRENKNTLKENRANVKRSFGSNEDMVVTIKEPLTYEDGKDILDDVKAGKTVVLNLEMLEMDKKTQIFYFVSGGLYSLEGSIQNVTKDIYVLVPNGVQVDGKLKDKISEKSLYQI